MSEPIEDHALIGDCHSAALVGRSGTIGWLCWPRFDSDACFASLLGTSDNGEWRIAPADTPVRVTRRYRGDTLILETRFETSTGILLLTDFMPPRERGPHLLRHLRCERGEVAVQLRLTLRFGYGALVPWVRRIDDDTLQAVAGPDLVVVRGSAPMRGEGLHTVANFTLRAGEEAHFSLSWQRSHLPPPSPPDVAQALAATEAWWQQWIAQPPPPPPHEHAGAVLRSLITLRALCFEPTGGIVAAPTTSLPEQPGGSRNWDYRYCWLRDATLTLLALMNAGFYREAEAWRAWLVRAVAGSAEQLQIMYGLAGERRLSEWEVPWLAGHDGARPVRIGNAAHAQLQLDVYGEVMDALYQARCGGLPDLEASWYLQRNLLQHLEQVWSEPDAGMWEMRGPRQHFTWSKVMAWVAFDRGVKCIEEFQVHGPIEHWRELRERIHADVCRQGYDAQLGSFVQAYGSRQLDANLLLLPSVGFIGAEDPRYVGTVAAIERHLVRDGFVLRYDTIATDDGLPPGEGAFLACSFWLVDAYAMLGRHEEAHRLFERLVGLRNDVGLLPEQYHPRSRRFAGNFPQAFSHLALIGSAHNLFRAAKPVEQRSGQSSSVQTEARRG